MTAKWRDPSGLERQLDEVSEAVSEARVRDAADRIAAGRASLADLRMWTTPWESSRLLSAYQAFLPLILAVPSALRTEEMSLPERALAVLHLPPAETLPDPIADALKAYEPQARYNARVGSLPLLLGDDFGMTTRRLNFRGQQLADGISDRALAASADRAMAAEQMGDEYAEALDRLGWWLIASFARSWTEEERRVVERLDPWDLLEMTCLEFAILGGSISSDSGELVMHDPVWLGADARSRYLGQNRSDPVNDVDVEQPTTRLAFELVSRRTRTRVARHV
jgi:hypothetical protein